MRFGVVIPTFNEADHIGHTIASLGAQVDRTGGLFGPKRLEVVVADTPGSDGTAEVARANSLRYTGMKVTVVSEPEPSMVAARIAGIEYLSTRPGSPPDALISVDADTTFPPTWLASIETQLAAGRQMVSTSGCFEHQFWIRCPTLSRRYVEQIGTIFFNTETAEAVTTLSDRPLFTPKLFCKFGRPVSDCGFAITTDLYRKLGGIRREYYGDEHGGPILAVGWSLMFRAELAGETIAIMSSPEYETSPRRLLHEPEALFSGASYLSEIEHYRSAAEDQYVWLEHFADRLDMEPLRRYAVKNYILQQCITRPERIMGNREYFGNAAVDIVETVSAWHANHPSPGTRDIFEFADQLADTYGAMVLDCVRKLADAEEEKR